MDKYLQLSHTEQYALLDAQRASGQTVRAFCAERGIKESRFYTWRTRRRKAAREQPSQPGFTALKPEVKLQGLRLQLAGGLQLAIAPDQLALAAELLLQMDRHHAKL